MKAKIALALGLVAACMAGHAAAQAPAPAKPAIAAVCKNCHEVDRNELRGIFENLSMKSKSMQIKIDNNTEIVKFDEKALKVVDDGDDKPGQAIADIAKG